MNTKDLVNLEHKKLQHQRADDIKKAWANNMLQIDTQVQQWVSKAKCQIKPNEPIQAEGVCYAEAIGPHNKIQRVPIKVLPSVTPLPRMNDWVPIKKNVLGEDNTELRNIPYIGENLQKQEQKFLTDLTKLYDGVHGAGKPSVIDNAMFVELVDAVTHSYIEQIEKKHSNGSETDTNEAMDKNGSKTINGNNNEEENVTSKEATPANPNTIIKEKIKGGKGEVSIQKEKPTFPMPLIFEAISNSFPNMGTPQQLQEKYIKYTGRQDPNHCIFPPNIDSIEAESLPAEHTLYNYNRLFCQRCLIYCCPLHAPEEQPVGMNFCKRPPQLYKTPTEPCGSDCFLLHNDMNETYDENKTFNGLRSVDSNEKEDNKAKFYETQPMNVAAQIFTPSSIWTNRDISIFRVLRVTLLKDYCSIAKAMLFKTCQQVYQFDQMEPDSFPKQEETANQSEPPRKKKKKKQSIWAHCRKIQLKKGSTTDVLFNYTPCHHMGPCDATCPCAYGKNFCERFCFCDMDCENRFPGCGCKTNCNTKQCPCVVAGRECDPDLCRSCGAHNFDLTKVTCKNIVVQRRLDKRLLMAPSDVAGWGCFIKDGAKRNEFISEYCGELITHEEADRRGKIYDQQKCSFLFNLNSEYAVDATRKGNITRFANHSVNPNCYARIVMVNGDHRIAIYAKCDIEPGEELFFDYRYGPNDKIKFLGIERNLK